MFFLNLLDLRDFPLACGSPDFFPEKPEHDQQCRDDKEYHCENPTDDGDAVCCNPVEDGEAGAEGDTLFAGTDYREHFGDVVVVTVDLPLVPPSNTNHGKIMVRSWGIYAWGKAWRGERHPPRRGQGEEDNTVYESVITYPIYAPP